MFFRSSLLLKKCFLYSFIIGNWEIFAKHGVAGKG